MTSTISRPEALTAASVSAADPPAGTLIDGCYPEPDYRDAFVVHIPGCDVSVDDFATAYFRSQPRWLALVSMNLLSRERLERATSSDAFQRGASIGAWDVIDRDADEIVFGDDMGFMEYRFSMRRLGPGRIEASTAVDHRSGRLGATYFALVKPLHRGFVRTSLLTTASALMGERQGT